jgi:hypothetical protein
MATNSNIGYILPNGDVRSIYCHWDGDVDFNGRILFENYTTQELVEELVSLGDLSSLGQKISPPEGADHTFDKPVKGVCVYYGRERGEQDSAAQTLSRQDFSSDGYAYLWDGARWLATTYDDVEAPLADLLESASA